MIPINSYYFEMYFLWLIRSAETFSSNLFLCSISELVKSAKHLIHSCTVCYENEKRGPFLYDLAALVVIRY